MAVVTVAATDTGRETFHWQVVPDNVLELSPIPRGIREYGGTAAIAALGAGDETLVNITLTFPTAFVYLPKSLSLQFQSDDLTTEFSNVGVMSYRPANVGALGIRRDYALVSDGAGFQGATPNSVQCYRPIGTWRHFIRGHELDQMNLFLADVSNDASTAGDVAWTADFWELDINQCLKWPINTPQPTLSY